MAAGYLLGISPVLTALVAAVVGALAIEWLRTRGGAAGDQALALVFYTGIAAGVVLVSRAGALNVNLFPFLFGSILTVTRTDLWIVLVLGVGALATIALLFRALVATVLDEEGSRVAGVPVTPLNVVVAVLAALTIARLDADRRDPPDRRADGAARDRREPGRLEPALDVRALDGDRASLGARGPVGRLLRRPAARRDDRPRRRRLLPRHVRPGGVRPQAMRNGPSALAFGPMPDRLLALPVEIEAFDLSPLECLLGEGLRATTLVELPGAWPGGARRGRHLRRSRPRRAARLGPSGGAPGGADRGRGLGALESLELTPGPPRWEAVRRYRRWAIEAAALDLALRQGDMGLADALGLRLSPLRFVVSRRVEAQEEVLDLLRRHPGARLKLDATPAWSEAVARAVAATGAVTTVDLKGTAPGSSVYLEPDPALYERVARLFPTAWLEDPALTPETERVLAPHRARIAWDEPIASAADVPLDAGAVNVKPARIGSIQEVFAVLERCATLGIPTYGGGQSEIGPGRGQAQVLASLCHPDAPNDLAPRAYNEADPPAGAPASPLAPPAGVTGFRWS